MSADVFDAVVIGCGPSGMTAASTIASRGGAVCVIDRNERPGGQIYRGVTSSPLQNPAILGDDYIAGRQIIDEFEKSGATLISNADVWHVGPTGEVLYSRDGGTERIVGKKLILSPGAMERPFPLQGWHLKNVMTAGNAQVMLKTSGVVCEDAVFVGTGPLLYLVIAQYLRLGVRVKALIDTTKKSPFLAGAADPLSIIQSPKLLKKGLQLLSEIRASGTRVYRNIDTVSIQGDTEAVGLKLVSKGVETHIEAEHVFLHQGVIPNTNMTRALSLKHEWSVQQLCWTPVSDEWGRTSHKHISVVGDGGGIVGAVGAEMTGRLSGLDIAFQLGLIERATRDKGAKNYLTKLKRLNRFRQFLDNVYKPRSEHRVPKDAETIVCRCEEQTLADLKAGFDLGATTPNSLKSQTRCGMGPCQGRQCGHTVTELIAEWSKKQPEEVGYYRLRSPQRLLSLDELSRFKTVSAASSIQEAHQ